MGAGEACAVGLSQCSQQQREQVLHLECLHVQVTAAEDAISGTVDVACISSAELQDNSVSRSCAGLPAAFSLPKKASAFN